MGIAGAWGVLVATLAWAGGPECQGDPSTTAAAGVRAADAAGWASAAPCFGALGLPHVEERAWSRVLDADPKRGKEALDRLGVLVSSTGDEAMLVDRAARLPADLRSPEVAARLDVIGGMDLAKAGERWSGMEKLGAVPATSPMAGPARYRLGRLQWEVGQLEEARTSFQACAEAPVEAPDLAEEQWLLRTRDLCRVALGHVEHARGDDKAALEALGEVDPDGPIGWLAADGAAWYGSKKAPATLSKAKDAFVPDIPLLLAGRFAARGNWVTAAAALSEWEGRWGPVRDALAAFLDRWSSDPSAAWSQWRASPADASVAADVLLNGEVAKHTRAAGRLAQEDGAAGSIADPELRAFAYAELAAARTEHQKRAGRALLAALTLRLERLQTLSSQSSRLAKASAPPSEEEARPLREPLSFLATDYGL